MGTDIHGVFQRQDATGWHDVPSRYEQGRHYQLFAVLAGVRNGYGFAGVPTGEAVKPISPPRGLPADFAMADDAHPLQSLEHMDPRRREWHEKGEPLEIWMGDHSHSWLTGEEILAWAEHAPRVVKIGVLSREEYEAWSRVGAPASYCGDVSGRNVVKINDNAIEKKRTPGWTHIRCTWESSLHEELSYFFDEVARLVTEYGKVRFVFGFDS